MNPREVFLRALERKPTARQATGSATSVVTADLMEKVSVFFPDAPYRNMQALVGAARRLQPFTTGSGGELPRDSRTDEDNGERVA